MSSQFPVSSAAASVRCFSVRAAVEPGALPRVLEAFAKRGLVPSSVHARVVGTGDEAAQLIDLQIAEMTDAVNEVIAEGLRQIVGVERVLTARKRLARSAA